MMNEGTIDQLNELIRVSKDGERGYRTAAADVRNSQLQSVFEEYARQRSSCARQRVVNAGMTGEPLAIVEKQCGKINEAHARLVRLKSDIAAGAEFRRNGPEGRV